MAKGTTFNVTRVVTKDQGDGKPPRKFFNQVGKVVLHDSGKTGVLFLHMLDGEFALFRQDPKEKGADAGGDTAED